MSFPIAANTVDAAALADELARYRVVDPMRLTNLLAEFTGAGPIALADYLVRRGELTAFQAARVLAGETPLLALGPYRLTGTCGRGAFGPLFTAVHTAKPGTFVVRVFPLRSLWKAKQAKQLARTLSAKVKHPAVAPLLDVDSANGFHYLVWARVEGAILADHVTATGPLPPGEAATVLGHLAGALGACHARGATHGALTPHAVALGVGGLPHLLELGAGTLLAQSIADDESLLDSMSAAFASAAVLTFAAPELAASPDAPTAAADQYALGAIGYFALTGLAPYPHPALADQLRAKRAGPPPSAAIVNPDVSADLAAAVERMMAPNPADRFATLDQVEARFAELAEAQPAPVAVQPAVDSLMLSRLQDARQGSGAISWSETESGALRPAERDGSDASITFDLPGAPETLPAAGPTAPARELVSPSRAMVETPTDLPFAARLEPDEPDEPDEPPRPAPDPRLTARAPVQWHATEPPAPGGGAPDDAPPARSVLWKKVKRNVLFWKAATDVVQVSVFGPVAVLPGQTVSLVVYVHPPDAAASVRMLSRAFLHDGELIGTGYLPQEVARTSELAVHVSVANAGVAKSLVTCEWRGQPKRLGFELHVPWESPEGASPGLISVGLDDVRIGKIEFRFKVLPRKA